MIQITANFSRDEFAGKCGCGLDYISLDTVKVLQEIRDHFSAPVTVVSGLRCEARNKAVGGAPRSQHMTGLAADIQVAGVPPRSVYNWLLRSYPGKYGFGVYTTFVHVDTRPASARWSG